MSWYTGIGTDGIYWFPKRLPPGTFVPPRPPVDLPSKQSDYSFYLTHPWRQDTDLKYASYAAWGTAAAALTAAAGLALATAGAEAAGEGAVVEGETLAGGEASALGDEAGSSAVDEGSALGNEAEEEESLANCFPAGTPVSTVGGLVPIETVKVRDEVWAYNLLKSEWAKCSVLKTFARDREGTTATITIAGEEIEATALHPFWVVSGEGLAIRPTREHLANVPQGATTMGRWVDAIDIRVGDELLLRDGRVRRVEDVRQQHYHDKVYNFSVDDLKCYAVGRVGVLVHNSNGEDDIPDNFEVGSPGTELEFAL